MKSLSRFLCQAAVLALILSAARELKAVPINDSFANAITLTGANVLTNGSNVGATRETGEPNHGGNAGGASVWYSWTAPTNGAVTITTAGSSFHTLLGVYTGPAVSLLTHVAGDGLAQPNVEAALTFPVQSGLTYKIAVDGYTNDSGSILLGLTLLSRPANDNLSNSIPVTTGTLVTGQNIGATSEPGEPWHAGISGGKSVWYSWTAPSNCIAMVTTAGSDFDTLVGVYTATSSSVTSLSLVTSNDDAPNLLTSFAGFNAISGKTYQIAVDGVNQSSGNIVLQVVTAPRLANDNFANAILLSGTNFSITASNFFCATQEFGETNFGSDLTGRTLWWKWVAPASGGVSIDTIGDDINPALAVCLGSSVNSLAEYTNGIQHMIFKVNAGTTYRLMAADDEIGQMLLNFHFSPSPTNDNFASDTYLGTVSGEADGVNFGATFEQGPGGIGSFVPRADTWGKTVWYSWVNPYTLPGTVIVTSSNSNFHTTIGVLTGGTNLASATRVASMTGTTQTNQLSHQMIPRQIYYVVVDGNSGGEGAFHINVSEAGLGPDNDNFANAIPLTGSNIYTTGQTTQTTSETGEPNHGGISAHSSAWWSWTSSGAGRLFITTAGSSYPTVLAIYQGADVAHLTLVTNTHSTVFCPGFSFLDFDITSTNAQKYYIAVDGVSGNTATQGSVNLALTFVPTPSNDAFANRSILTGPSITTIGSVVAATQEIGEFLPAAGTNAVRSVWYSWTAPTNLGAPSAGVTLRVTGVSITATTNDPIVNVFQGNSVASLTSVPVTSSQLIGNVRQVAFDAQAGTTYQIAIAGGQSTASGVDTSFAQRTNAIPPDPVNETGTFILRLNYSTLALRITNLVPADVGFSTLGSNTLGWKIPIAAGAQICNYSATDTGPVRVRLLGLSSSAAILGSEGSWSPVMAQTVAASSTVIVPVNGDCPPYSSVFAVLEEQMGGTWFFRDSAVLVAGIGAVNHLCNLLLGGGVTLLEPGLSGQCFCPANLTSVKINGPATVAEGSSAAYTGTAYFDNGSAPNFTNTIWATSNTNHFPITTNGILTAGSVTSNTPISVTTYFSYLGNTQSTNTQVTILNLPSPQLQNITIAQNHAVQFTVQGVPGRLHIIQSATNLTAPIVWTPLSTNTTSQGGSFIFTDSTSTNFSRRYYRVVED